MKMIPRFTQSVSFLMIFAMTMLSLPYQAAQAGMVGTRAAIEADSGVGGETVSSGRARIEALLQREEVRAQLEDQDISAEQARAWVDSLTDSEIAMAADKLLQLPAGGEE